MNIEEAKAILKKIGFTVTPSGIVLSGYGAGRAQTGGAWLVSDPSGQEPGIALLAEELIERAIITAQLAGWSTEPEGWDVNRDGEYPHEEWDPAWGEYPMEVSSETVTGSEDDEAGQEIRRVIGADRGAAREIIATQKALGTPSRPLPKGTPEFEDRGGFRFQYDPQTGEHEIFRGKSPEPEAEEIPLPAGTPRVISKDGFLWEWDRDTGRHSERIEADTRETGPGNFDELAFQHIMEGGVLTKDMVDRLLYVDSIRDQLDRRRITPLEAFNLAAPFMQNPQHLREMMTALMSETGQYMSQPDFEGAQRLNAPNTQTPTGTGAETRAETNGLQQAIDDIPGGLTLDQWENASFGFQRDAWAMELAPDLEAYTQNPEPYNAQAGALVNELNSRLTQAGAIPGHDPETRGPVGALDPGSVPGAAMRTIDEENELRRLLGSRMHFGVMEGGRVPAGAIVDRPGAESMENPEDALEVARRVSRRGNVPMPNALQERMKELQRKAPYSAGATPTGTFGQPSSQPWGIGGTPFKRPPSIAKDPWGYLGTKAKNKAAQDAFRRRGTPQRTFA